MVRIISTFSSGGHWNCLGCFAGESHEEDLNETLEFGQEMLFKRVLLVFELGVIMFGRVEPFEQFYKCKLCGTLM